jgi:bacteriocin-like protein
MIDPKKDKKDQPEDEKPKKLSDEELDQVAGGASSTTLNTDSEGQGGRK